MNEFWWRLEMAAPAELEESLLWKLNALGIARVAVRHRPQAPLERQLVAWLPGVDWPETEQHRLEQALAPLARTFGLELPPLRWFRQVDEDWSRSWKQHWEPDPVGERLLILPAWLELPAAHADRLVIRIDPGSAFGTGSHPTTRLCLEMIERLADPAGLGPIRVADLGSGSGILGIAALLHGAASVAAADTDAPAVRATLSNAVASGVHARLEAVQGSTDQLESLLDHRPADLLLCNILAPVIEALGPGFDRLLAPDGVGLLSGMLVTQAAGLELALARWGWRARLTAEQGGWGLMMLHKTH
ncbi:MAG: 50S ribosomal protein L11 methyltransferase [Cyanobacteriota bacterium]|nr:50S ribosomal protein L11 methyltransferase [Cyanobacteriota bacterium]